MFRNSNCTFILFSIAVVVAAIGGAMRTPNGLESQRSVRMCASVASAIALIHLRSEGIAIGRDKFGRAERELQFPNFRIPKS